MVFCSITKIGGLFAYTLITVNMSRDTKNEPDLMHELNLCYSTHEHHRSLYKKVIRVSFTEDGSIMVTGQFAQGQFARGQFAQKFEYFF